MPDPSTAPRDAPPTAADVLQLLDARRARIARWLHDRPVQQLVAARLLLETARGAGDDASYAKGLAAVTKASDLLRALMWELEPPPWTEPHADLEDLAARLDVALDRDRPPDRTCAPGPALLTAVRCAHDLAGDVLEAGTRATSLTLRGCATLRLALHEAGTAEHPRPRLGLATARGRAALLGGRVTVRTAAGARSTTVALPAAAR